ncbi:hypothetical protein BAUCODRAFT_448988 [Baudoinia panamericana UAMH 10762]|uniref:Uncharacterized protein n=1 Tax=Baudoinia panamericana (strain UAMH 10762) TaxID=717646 RepID=M2NEG4_BAUPA|nr:uncharacterized protein BAUCODRAFT_448988 [Baudoinia panamericana UAMH 10762]EMC97355.1 hypothetical protein BAUCODRAFT_448988 [Baudoinia panamericana UAMH 10762]
MLCQRGQIQHLHVTLLFRRRDKASVPKSISADVLALCVYSCNDASSSDRYQCPGALAYRKRTSASRSDILMHVFASG